MRRERRFWITMIAALVVICAAAIAADAPPAPIKLTDAESLKLQDARAEVLQIQANMKQLEDLYRNMQDQLKTAQPTLDKAIEDVKAAHECKDCEVNFKDHTLSPKPKPADPEKK